MKEEIYATTPLWRPSMWERVVLFFLPTHISEDDAEPWEYPIRLYYKKWRGRIYIMKEERNTSKKIDL